MPPDGGYLPPGRRVTPGNEGTPKEIEGPLKDPHITSHGEIHQMSPKVRGLRRRG